MTQEREYTCYICGNRKPESMTDVKQEYSNKYHYAGLICLNCAYTKLQCKECTGWMEAKITEFPDDTDNFQCQQCDNFGTRAEIEKDKRIEKICKICLKDYFQKPLKSDGEGYYSDENIGHDFRNYVTNICPTCKKIPIAKRQVREEQCPKCGSLEEIERIEIWESDDNGNNQEEYYLWDRSGEYWEKQEDKTKPTNKPEQIYHICKAEKCNYDSRNYKN